MAIIDDIKSLIPQLAKGQRLLGLDLGSKTIGLSLSDTSQKIATPFDTIKRRKFMQDSEQLKTIIDNENIGAIICGLPLNMDGSKGPRVQATYRFIRNLEAHDGFPDLAFGLWDERMSTQAVTRTLLSADASRAKRAQVVDKMAAAYILQGYLDFYWRTAT